MDHNNILSALSLTAVFLRQFNPLLARGTLISRCKKFKQVPQLYRGSPLSFLPSFCFFCLNQASIFMKFPIESHHPCLLTDSVLTLKNYDIFVDDLLIFPLRNCEKFRCTTHSRIIETLGTWSRQKVDHHVSWDLLCSFMYGFEVLCFTVFCLCHAWHCVVNYPSCCICI